MGALDDKVAIVTGAGSGIGLAAARRLADEGATILCVDINGEAAEKAAVELDGRSVQSDVSDASKWPRIVQAAEELGGVDIAYLNAGVTTGTEDVELVTDEQYRRIMGVNVDHIFFGMRAVVPAMEKRGGGYIIATSSLAGIIAFPGDPVYTLTKHAVVGLVRGVAPRLALKNITVNAICPGIVDTPLIDGQIRGILKDTGFPLIDPSDVAEAVLWCITSGESGQAVVVQAGREPIPYRFGRPPGPRQQGAEGKIPPEWLADPASNKT